jgi:uncharacterized protein
MTDLTPFEVPFRSFVLRGDTYRHCCNAVVLHGAGKSSRTRFTRLRRALNERGIPTAAFDYVGHGETGGELIGSSLHDRTEQAAAVIRKAAEEPLTLIGASMSGHTAIKLTEMFRVNHLILLVPAVYAARAYRIPFGPDFSAAIRLPGSWKESDAWEILAGFRGNLMLIAAEDDPVIPKEVIQRIFEAVKKAQSRYLHVVPGSHHIGLFPRDEDISRAADMIVAMGRKQ